MCHLEFFICSKIYLLKAERKRMHHPTPSPASQLCRSKAEQLIAPIPKAWESAVKESPHVAAPCSGAAERICQCAMNGKVPSCKRCAHGEG